MATTLDTIKANILAAVPELTNMSAASIWLKIAEVIDAMNNTLITEMSDTTLQLDNDLLTKNYGGSLYYTNKALAYQNGDSLSVDANGQYYYATIAPVGDAKYLIAQAAFVNNSGRLGLKVAKMGTTELEALTYPDELDLFQNYIDLFVIPGLTVTCSSVAGNELDGRITVRYNKSADYTVLKAAVESAYVAYKNTFAFDGVLYLNDVESYIKAQVTGVRNVYYTEAKIYTLSFYADGFTDLDSGYFTLKSGWQDYITYIPI
jgi:hypothetical protein